MPSKRETVTLLGVVFNGAGIKMRVKVPSKGHDCMYLGKIPGKPETARTYITSLTREPQESDPKPSCTGRQAANTKLDVFQLR